jgi:hypothetical protein
VQTDHARTGTDFAEERGQLLHWKKSRLEPILAVGKKNGGACSAFQFLLLFLLACLAVQIIVS